MLSGQLPLVLFWLYVASFLGAEFYNLVGGMGYDLRSINQERQRRKHPYAKQYRQRPLITIVVLAYDNQATVEQCLQSILSSSYRNYEIVVVDNGCRDNTRKLVRQFKQAHHKQKIRLVINPERLPFRQALLSATERRSRSEFVLPLEATSMLERNSLRALQGQFAADKRLSIVAAQQRREVRYTIYNRLGQIAQALEVRRRKVSSLRPSTRLMVSFDTMYRKDSLQLLLRRSNDLPLGQALRRRYASEAIVTHLRPIPATNLLRVADTNRSLRLPFKLIRALFALVEPIVLGYVIYLAVVFTNPLPLLVVWSLVILRISTAICSDRRVPTGLKLSLIVSFTPIIFLLWCVRSLSRVFYAGLLHSTLIKRFE